MLRYTYASNLAMVMWHDALSTPSPWAARRPYFIVQLGGELPTPGGTLIFASFAHLAGGGCYWRFNRCLICAARDSLGADTRAALFFLLSFDRIVVKLLKSAGRSRFHSIALGMARGSCSPPSQPIPRVPLVR
ncbi:MAG: hypothetical protein Greene041679_288 [Parcubacteria group bacterium Greene0416_79]|nr:MAG: hypothetical protein Greene041679_288 [Parcubacteria group bacterium Greene0416_79]